MPIEEGLPPGRLVAETFPASPGEDRSYTYDDTIAGAYDIGRLSSATDAGGSAANACDLADKLVGVTYPSDRIVTYARDAPAFLDSGPPRWAEIVSGLDPSAS